MSPPLRRGRQQVLQRAVGVLFLLGLVGLVGLSVALYQKAFTPVVTVTVQADRIGNQLSKGADVKARGLLVGQVRKIERTGRQATLTLALDEDLVDRLPADSRAQMIPKTLFGEKIVDLLIDDTSTARPLRDGDTITQDRSSTARETSQALDDLLPLLQTLKPAQVSTTLNALSGALRGRGNTLGENLVRVDSYLTSLNPELPAVRRDLDGLSDLSDTLDRTTPDLLPLLDNSAFLARSLQQQSEELTTFLTSTTTSTRELDQTLTRNQNRLIRLATDSLPSLQVYQRYSPEFPCLAKGLSAQSDLAEVAFGGGQPGLHITLEFVEDQGGYLPGDEPAYGEDAGPTCRGLPPHAPLRPFPVDREVTDGYCDDQEQQPGVQTECTGRDKAAPSPGDASSAVVDPARALAPVAADRRIVAAVIGPVLGVPAHEVPDLAVLLFGPLARGTQVGLSR